VGFLMRVPDVGDGDLLTEVTEDLILDCVEVRLQLSGIRSVTLQLTPQITRRPLCNKTVSTCE